jgi:hypothetical protein
METCLPNRLRRLGAAMMFMAYALGVIAPTVVFAYSDHASIIHVLSESHGGMLVLHFHDHNSDRHNHPVKSGGDTAHHCCGVISLAGLEPSAGVTILASQTTMALLPPLPPSPDGRCVACLERPPKLS